MCWVICSSSSCIIYGVNSMSKLPEKIVKFLNKKKLSISFAESCTGGLLSSKITSVSGSSKVFKLGLITYSNNSKINILKVPKKIINKYGAVSKETCFKMVSNLVKLSKTNIAVSITGIAGPKGGSKLKPVGLVYIGFYYKNNVKILKCLFKSKIRSRIQSLTVNKVFLELLKLFK